MNKKMATGPHSRVEGAKLNAASYSIAANVGLIALKLVVALLTGSIAILAEVFHSAFDLLASVLAFLGIRKAEEPADRTHHYGHEKFENLSSLAQTLLIVLTAGFVIFEAVNRIWHPAKLQATELGLLVMLFTIGIDFWVSRFLHGASSKFESSALEADAMHFTTDLYSAIAVIAGLAVAMLGFPVFDSLAAIVVALVMLWISFQLGMKAIHVLSDKGPSDATMERMEAVIPTVNGVRGFHKLRARQAGSKLFVEAHLKVAPRLSVRKGHAISHEVKRRLQKEFPNIKEATLHVEPSEW